MASTWAWVRHAFGACLLLAFGMLNNQAPASPLHASCDAVVDLAGNTDEDREVECCYFDAQYNEQQSSLQSQTTHQHADGEGGYRGTTASRSVTKSTQSQASGNSPYVWQNGPSASADFFPIGVWLQSPSNASKYKSLGINTFVGLYQGPTESQLSTLASNSLPVFAYQNSVGLTSSNRRIIKGWTQLDEPDNAQPNGQGGYGPCITTDELTSRYQSMKAADATRPVFLNFGKGVFETWWFGRGFCTGDTGYYRRAKNAADIFSYDVYPINEGHAPADVAKGLDNLISWVGSDKIVWNFIEASKIANAAPTPAQLKAEVWMSLVHGSQGIMYFVHEFNPFREDGIFNHPDLVIAVTAVDAEITSLAPVLNSSTVAGDASVSSSGRIDIMVKNYGGDVYVFAVAMQGSSASATLMVPSVTSGTVEVIGEGRQLSLANHTFQDSFAGYGVHLYKITSS